MLGERAGLDHLRDLDLRLVPDVVAQVFDQAIDLRVVFGPLVLWQAEHVAVIVAQLRIVQRHCSPFRISLRDPARRDPPFPEAWCRRVKDRLTRFAYGDRKYMGLKKLSIYF